MGDRYWLWMGGRLLLAVAIVGWAATYIGTGSSEKEFQKTLEAMKHVRSFRVAYSGIGYPDPNYRNEMLWEVDCNSGVVHSQWHMVETSKTPPIDLKREELFVAGVDYERKPDGSWSSGTTSRANSATATCRNLADGTDTRMLPDIGTMIKRGILQKGDKKTVNGVRCREWLVTMRGGPAHLEHDTICLGLEDRLPYEMTTDWSHARYSISDYNTPIQFDLPAGAAVQPASATGSN